MKTKYKTLTLRKDTWKALIIFKYDKDFETLDDVVKYLLDSNENKVENEKSDSSETQMGKILCNSCLELKDPAYEKASICKECAEKMDNKIEETDEDNTKEEVNKTSMRIQENVKNKT